MNIWLNEWTFIYIDAKTIEIAKMTRRRFVRDFLMTLSDSNSDNHIINFVDNHLTQLKKMKENSNMHILIEKLQAYSSLRQQKKMKNQNQNSHSVFSTEKMKNQSFESTFNDQKRS
jgi:hypothetical protein